MIWAQTLDGVIGADNAIPWRIPEDMAHFKETTSGHPVVMGRRTWDSIPPRFRPLPGRRSIVVTRQPDWAAEGAERAGSVHEALELSAPDPVWIAGGAEIYRAAMSFATLLCVTEIDSPLEGDAHAPEIGPQWREEAAVAQPQWHTSTSGLRFRTRWYARG
ncbi:dihydrofolate reductase [Nocardia callitridis]